MNNRRILSSAFALALAALSCPALAQSNRTPPGDPCGSGPGVGRGNPCNGNNGNPGGNGNSGG